MESLGPQNNMDQMDVDAPTKDNNNQAISEHGANSPAAGDTADGNTSTMDLSTGECLQKPPVPAWMTDPKGKAVLSVIPSIDKPHEEECICVHYFTATYMSLIARMHRRRSDKPQIQTAMGNSVATQDQAQMAQVAQQQQRHHHQQAPQVNHQLAPQSSQQGINSPHGSSQIIPPAPSAPLAPRIQPPQEVYVVLVQYQPKVEYGGSEFSFSLQEPQYGNAFALITHYTKVFVDSVDARKYALELFTERISMDYRYVMQKAWEDLSAEEIREYGVTEDGPSPHIRGFNMRALEDDRSWQIQFGCDEEFCRIGVVKTLLHDPKIADCKVVGPGQPHGGIEHPMSL